MCMMLHANSFAILVAYVTDLILGDPQWMPHPVRGIGGLITIVEKPLYRSGVNKRLSGLILVVTVIFTAVAGTSVLIYLANKIGAYTGLIFSAFLIYTSLSAADLKKECMGIYEAVVTGDLQDARQKLRRIVGRDTGDLSEKEIIRATVECAAESTVDGIVSPLFYAFIGGAPLAIAYKAVNTLDSMVGYQNERYNDFGYFAAEIDTVVNFVPARVTGALIPVAAWLCGKDGTGAFLAVMRYGKSNSDVPEAGVAGALGVRLGGVNYYQGRQVVKPFLGEERTELEAGHIKDAVRLSYVCSALAVVAGMIASLLL